MGNIKLENKTVLVTGSAGFIGYYVCKKLLNEFNDIKIIGYDNMNDYYDVKLKEYRLNELEKYDNFTFIKGDLADKNLLNETFKKYKPKIVVNLAAQAGVRYSIDNPEVYMMSNIMGFFNIIEACRNEKVQHLVYASSSSVYGSNKKVPFNAEEDTVDTPVSLYAATKKTNELLAHSYSKLYNIPTTGLRFFTVYGPLGRPDMSYFAFTNKLLKGEKIKVFNYGKCARDFTYAEDVAEAVVRVIQKSPNKKVGSDGLPIPPYAIYNVGNSEPVNLMDFINILKEELVNVKLLPKDFDLKSKMELVPMQPGDLAVTYADITSLEKKFGFRPKTSIRDGLREFAKWYKEYYK